MSEGWSGCCKHSFLSSRCHESTWSIAAPVQLKRQNCSARSEPISDAKSEVPPSKHCNIWGVISATECFLCYIRFAHDILEFNYEHSKTTSKPLLDEFITMLAQVVWLHTVHAFKSCCGMLVNKVDCMFSVEAVSRQHLDVIYQVAPSYPTWQVALPCPLTAGYVSSFYVHRSTHCVTSMSQSFTIHLRLTCLASLIMCCLFRHKVL